MLMTPMMTQISAMSATCAPLIGLLDPPLALKVWLQPVLPAGAS
jgi:hypothetical protein